MHPQLAMILVDQRAADIQRAAERWRRAREVPDPAKRRFGFRPSLALRLPRAHADLRAAR